MRRIARWEKETGVCISRAVKCFPDGGRQHGGVQFKLWRPVRLRLRNDQLQMFVTVKRHRVDLEGIVHYPRDGRTCRNHQWLARESQNRVSVCVVSYQPQGDV